MGLSFIRGAGATRHSGITSATWSFCEMMTANPRDASRDGFELHQTVVDLYTFRNGLCIRLEGFETKAKALEAAGLSE
jgi:hypothetical protein